MSSRQHIPEGSRSLKYSAFVVLVMLFVLLVASVVYYPERMLFSDAPHIMFRIINDHKLQITEFRYGSFITQCVPLLAAYLRLPLKAIMILYSASFSLFYLAVASFITFRYRQYGLVVLMGLYYILFCSDAWYWTNNEVHQGVAWLILAFAVTNHMARASRPLYSSLPVFIILFGLAISTHPLILIAAIFLWSFSLFTVHRHLYPPSRAVLFSAVLLSLCVLKYSQGAAHDQYDNGKMEMVTRFSLSALRYVGHWRFTGFFSHAAVHNYWLALLILISGLAIMTARKMYLPAAFTLFYAMGFLLIVAITFRDVDNAKFYLESEYMLLAIICSAPFVYYVLPALKSREATAIMVIICCIRLAYICHSQPVFAARVAIIKNIDNKMSAKKITKLIITGSNATIAQPLLLTWAMPVESICFSAMNGAMPQRTCILMDTAEVRKLGRVSNNELLTGGEKRSPHQLNGRYFAIDTTTAYQVLDYATLMQ